MLTEDDGRVGIDWDRCRNSDAGEINRGWLRLWVGGIPIRKSPRRALAFQCFAEASYTQRQQA